MSELKSKPRLEDFGISQKDLEFKKNFKDKLSDRRFVFFQVLCTIILLYFALSNNKAASDNILLLVVSIIFFVYGLPWLLYLLLIPFYILELILIKPLFNIELRKILDWLEEIYYEEEFKKIERIKLAEKRFNEKLYEWERQENKRIKRQEEINREIQQKKQEELRRKKDFWFNLSGYQFEEEIANLYRNRGYKASVTSYSGDGGVDVVLFDKSNNKIFVQCKNHKNPISPATIRELYGVMMANGVSKGILIGSGGFTKGVYDFARNVPIKLIDINGILKLTED